MGGFLFNKEIAIEEKNIVSTKNLFGARNRDSCNTESDSRWRLLRMVSMLWFSNPVILKEPASSCKCNMNQLCDEIAEKPTRPFCQLRGQKWVIHLCPLLLGYNSSYWGFQIKQQIQGGVSQLGPACWWPMNCTTVRTIINVMFGNVKTKKLREEKRFMFKQIHDAF